MNSARDITGFDLNSAKELPMDDEVVYRDQTGKSVQAPSALNGAEFEYLDDTQNNGKKPEDYFGFVDTGVGTIQNIAKGYIANIGNLGAGIIGSGLASDEKALRDLEATRKQFEPIDFLLQFKPGTEGTAAGIRISEKLFGGKHLSFEKELAKLNKRIDGIKELQRDMPVFLKAAGLSKDKEEGAGPVSQTLMDIGYDFGGGVQSFVQSIGLTMITGNPALATMTFAAQQKSQDYQEARDKGFSIDVADKASNITAATTGAIEAVGTGALFTMMKGAKPFQKMFRGFLEQSIEEGTQELSSILIKNDFNITDTDFKSGAKQVGYAAFLGGLVGAPVSLMIESDPEAFEKDTGIKADDALELAKTIESRVDDTMQEQAGNIMADILRDENSPLKDNKENQEKVKKIINDFVTGKDIDLSELSDDERSVIEAAIPKVEKVEPTFKGMTIEEADKSSLERPVTIDSPNYNSPERQALRKNIVDQLYGQGAAKKERIAEIVIGPPAAGKNSVMAEPLVKKIGGLLIDSDNAKQLLPEYDNGLGAVAVHAESSSIIYDKGGLLERVLTNGDNIVFSTVGSKIEDISTMIETLKQRGYTVNVKLVSVPPEVSVQRMSERFSKTGRVVPLDYLKSVADGPLKTFEAVKGMEGVGYVHYDNNVPEGQSPRIIETNEPGSGNNAQRQTGPDDGRNGQGSATVYSEQEVTGESLTDLLIKAGGVTNDGGYFTGIDFKAGLQKSSGLSIDQALDLAVREGFLDQGSSINDFVSVLIDEKKPVGPTREQGIVGQRVKQLEDKIAELNEKIEQATTPKELNPLNAQLDKAYEELDAIMFDGDGVATNKLPVMAVEASRANETKEALKQVRALFAEAKSRALDDVNFVQERIINLIEASGMEAKDRAKFIRKIKNTKTPRQLRDNFPEIESRIMEIMKASERKAVISNIRKLVARARRSKVIAVDFVKQIESLFNEIDIKKRTDETLNSLQKTLDYKNKNPDAEMPKRVLKKLDILNKKRLEDITSEELEEIHDGLMQLVKQGKTKLDLMNAQKKRLKENRLEELSKESVPLSDKNISRAAIGERLTAMENIKNRFAELSNRVGRGLNAINPMDVFFDMLDGGKSYKGSNHRIFKQTIDTAFSRYLNLKESATREVKDLTDKLKLNEKNFEKIGVWATLQQEGGSEKLKATGITEAELNTLSLTDAETQMYTLMRTKLDEMLPAIKQIMRTVYNQDVEGVKDYFPFMTDFEAMKDFEIQDQIGDTVPLVGKKKNVEKGFTQSRVGGGKPIRIDALGVFLKHMDNAAYLIEMGTDIKGLGDVASSKEYGEAVGDIGQEMVVEWITLLARKGSAPGRHNFTDTLRRNVGLAMLGFKLSTILIQPTALMDGSALVGGDYVARGTVKVTDPAWRKFLVDNLPELRERVGDDPAYMDMGGGGIITDVRQAGFWALKRVDLLAASSVAAGAYIKSVEQRGGTVDLSSPDPVAIQEAQLMMRRTQSSAFAKDAAPALSRGALTGNVSFDKLVLQFQSFMLNRWSLIKHDMWALGVKKGNTAQAANIATWLILANMAEIGVRGLSKEIISLLTGDDEEPKDEDSVLEKAIYQALGNVPFVSQAVSSFRYGSVPVPSIGMINQIYDRMEWAGNSKSTEKKIKHYAEAVVLATGAGAGIPGTIQAETIIRKSLKDDEQGAGF